MGSPNSKSGRKPRICIVSHFAWGAMTGGKKGHVGGVERQTSLTAKWLAARGYEVSIACFNEGQELDVMVDGVRVISLCKITDGVRGLRFLHPRTTSLFAALKKADADVYYHNLAEYHTGMIAHWCQRNGRKFVYSTAHDFDCTASLPALKKGYERFLYKYGIRNADCMIVQTEFQRELLKKSFGLESVSLPMPCPGPSPEEFRKRTFPAEKRVAWVGRADPQKRPEWLIEIAEKMPEVTFDVAAANVGYSDYGRDIMERASKVKNINWMGSVPRDQMPDVYKRSLCLLSTSVHEGFPNTFLESWSWGTPLVTTFDPDGLTAKKGLGKPFHDVASGVAAIRALLDNAAQWEEMSQNSRRYYETYHMVDNAIGRFERLFVSVWKTSDAAEHARQASLPAEQPTAHSV